MEQLALEEKTRNELKAARQQYEEDKRRQELLLSQQQHEQLKQGVVDETSNVTPTPEEDEYVYE